MTIDSRDWLRQQLEDRAPTTTASAYDEPEDDEYEDEGEEDEGYEEGPPTSAELVARALADPEVDAFEWASFVTGASAEDWRAACRDAGLSESTHQPRMHELPHSLRVQIEQERLNDRIHLARTARR